MRSGGTAVGGQVEERMNEECPLCGKPVMGRTALLGHLEFGHDVADPGPYLEQLLRPDEHRRRRGPGMRALARRGGVPLAGLALVAGALLAYQQLVVESPADTAAADTIDTADEAVADRSDAVEAAVSPTIAPVDPTTSTAAPTTAAAITSTTTPPTTAAPTTTTAARSDLEFRKPFLVDASHEGCHVRDGQAVHTISFTFSGSRNITFDGEFFPDRTGDGPHTTAHPVAVGTKGYLDHVVVSDPDGEGHEVAISPPVYLGGC